MRILVLGGSGFVGRAVADDAIARGHDVTVLNRGTRDPVPGATLLVGDRTAPGGLAALGSGTWDAVVDTWSADGAVVGAAAAALSGRAGHYTYVSSRSVYHYDETGAAPPLTEDAPLVAADDPGYAGDKLRGEHGAARFAGPVLLARAGLILGPREDVGRLPWWLSRLARGGPVVAPGPPDLPLQYIDARDLAAFVLDAAAAGLGGPCNVVGRSGDATMGSLLATACAVTGDRAQLRWIAPDVLERAGAEPWTELPIWLPPGPLHAFMHRGDVTRALAAGLRCRPLAATVADTWAWMTSLGGPIPQRADRARAGLPADKEARLLAAPVS
ncbi:NAD-dependent epimerase/dehydratase family protein [Actinoplanes sp. NPDC023714]|uniref:NAD-dependent epimerase/dehydratase family protein n=1 Tax=Actinoplanes sp. NPDC023714 TaxID=3154322 RepID=UPI0033DA611E